MFSRTFLVILCLTSCRQIQNDNIEKPPSDTQNTKTVNTCISDGCIPTESTSVVNEGRSGENSENTITDGTKDFGVKPPPGSNVESHGSHVELQGSHVELQGSHVESLDLHFELKGSHVESQGSHVQKQGSGADVLATESTPLQQETVGSPVSIANDERTEIKSKIEHIAAESMDSNNGEKLDFVGEVKKSSHGKEFEESLDNGSNRMGDASLPETAKDSKMAEDKISRDIIYQEKITDIPEQLVSEVVNDPRSVTSEKAPNDTSVGESEQSIREPSKKETLANVSSSMTSNEEKSALVDSKVLEYQSESEADETSLNSKVEPLTVSPPTDSGSLHLHSTMIQSPIDHPTTANFPGVMAGGPTSPSKSEDDIAVPKKDIDMQSFDEWKQKEEEKNKNYEEQTTQTVVVQVKVKGTKKVNYASVTCGAKIVAANPEAQNPSFILFENKDQYMINPCKAKKVFTVELCEAVQVHAMDIGNLELFSSLPQKFDVHVSDRYPSKEWKALGTFHARDERTIQTFSVEDSLVFAKYIKIEMLSHYGVEHYCPLSILRVFGVTVDEDDDAEEEHDAGNHDDEGEEMRDNPTNLFASATDTVLSLVKTVLTPATDTRNDGDVSNIKDPNLMESNGNMSSLHSPSDEKKSDQPCASDARMDIPVVEQKITEGRNHLPDVPVIKVGIDTIKVEKSMTKVEKDMEESKPSTEMEVATDETDKRKEFDIHQKQGMDTITLIETPGTPLTDLIRRCQFCDDGRRDLCWFDFRTVCGYYRAMVFVYPLSCPEAWQNLDKSRKRSTTVIDMDHENSDSLNTHESILEVEMSLTNATNGILESNSDGGNVSMLQRGKTSDRSELMSVSERDGAPLDQSDSEKKFQRLDDSLSQKNFKISADALPSIPSLAKSGQDTKQIEKPLEKSPSEEIPVTVEKPGTASAPGQTENGYSQFQLSQNNDHGKFVPADVNNRTKTKLDDVSSNSSVSGSGSKKDVYPEIKSKMEVMKEYDLEAAMLDEVTYHKLTSSRGKESIFIKLKNRIRTLELNLNLTNRYLEELSQRYKRQTEEMYTSLNKTISKLSNTAKSAEERDMRQQDRIQNLEMKVENLSALIESAHQSIDQMHQQMIERHLVLMSIEMVIFVTILTYCIGHRRDLSDHVSNSLSVGSSLLTSRSRVKSNEPQNLHQNCVSSNRVARKRRRNSQNILSPRDSSFSESECECTVSKHEIVSNQRNGSAFGQNIPAVKISNDLTRSAGISESSRISGSNELSCKSQNRKLQKKGKKRN